MSNASQLDEAIWMELNADWDLIAAEAAHTYEHYGSEHGVYPGFDVVDDVPEIGEGTTVTAMVKVARFHRLRVGALDGCQCG
jgi:putative restriction endonuclease